MIDKILADEWRILETGFDPKTHRFSESIFSLGNGHMGLRGFFEEKYSGDTLPGIYIAGVYYPDKTRVGWWKNGYPEFFAKVVNSTNWIGCDIEVNGTELDLFKVQIRDYQQELNMRNGRLIRSFILVDKGQETRFVFEKFLSMADNNLAAIKILITPLNHTGVIGSTPYLNGGVSNEDSNYGEKFWEEVDRGITQENAYLTMKTKKTGFLVTTAISVSVCLNGKEFTPAYQLISKEQYGGFHFQQQLSAGETMEIIKYVAVCTSRDYPVQNLSSITLTKLNQACQLGYHRLFKEHALVMDKKWADCDVIIEGDIWAQQGIRYNIFQLTQTYTGKDPRLNIGPKGFTGEKYGGGTYWDTEAFCFPFYLYTNEEVARNLLLYRYLHLEAARENARKLGFKGALYPMVTMDGQECHNEWEITFEEIHRNGAIAYAIYNYTNYTGKNDYLFDKGLEVLTEISRFWADRVNYNFRKGKYMILGVTGPNEYENNVNNNWYTNTMAAWTLEYTLTSLEDLRETNQSIYIDFIKKMALKSEELVKWKDIIDKMYYPFVDELQIFEQNDGFMDKELLKVTDLSPDNLPLNKHWSWDRILRSSFIKQADVIQGIYYFPNKFDIESMKRNFDFYEPMTVHESSLSASIHSIVASRLGYHQKAYELYLRTARLDLNDYNHDTVDGIHLTSMAGSWLAIVQGFAGVRVENNQLYLKPYLPKQWKSYSFQMTFRGRQLQIRVTEDQIHITQLSGEPLMMLINSRPLTSKIGQVSAVKFSDEINLND